MIVNGVQLTEGQSATVRVALCAFFDQMRTDGLGDDEHGKAMAEAYASRSYEVMQIIGGAK
jgi:hypothetical protein